MTLSWGHLFAGIDGFGLGLGAIGGRTAWTVELEDFPHRILTLREPDAEHLRDIREVSGPPKVDGISGGFPCQDLSNAGRGAGIRGDRSGLYTQLIRIVGEVGPEVVLIENVPALLHRGFELVVRDLVELGYGVEWDCLPAAAFGAWHLRDRVWIVAHRLGAPCIFGQPATLFALAPGQAVDLVGGDEDDDEAPVDSWQRWPRAGWVDGDPGLVMPLEPLARLAAVKAGATLWPTPTASDWKGAGPLDRRPPGDDNLATRVARWPPPTVHGNHARREHPSTGADGLATAVARHPRRASQDSSDSPAFGLLAGRCRPEDAGGRERAKGRNGNGFGVPLAIAVAKAERGLWPTPKASPSGPDYARAGREGSGGDDLATAAARVENAPAGSGALNPPWVEWLMGFPLGWTDPTVANDQLAPASWASDPATDPDGIPRVAANVAHRRQRLTALGNALVPAAPAWIGARYLAATEARLAA